MDVEAPRARGGLPKGARWCVRRRASRVRWRTRVSSVRRPQPRSTRPGRASAATRHARHRDAHSLSSADSTPAGARRNNTCGVPRRRAGLRRGAVAAVVPIAQRSRRPACCRRDKGRRLMRALITGGAGFIGSHLSEALLGASHQVLVLDNLSTGSIENIAHLKGRPGFEYFIDTVENEGLLAELIDRSDVVFHFAAAVGVKLIVEQPVYTIETNVHGTEVVLKHANKKKKLVVIASTSEVYGKSEDVPFREDSDLVMGPTPKHRWAYACSKAIDEFLALAYWKERKLPVIIVRFFNTVGPRQTGRYGMVIPNFVRQALAGEPMTVFGSGEQLRAFTHVADVVGALMALARHPDAIGQVINVGNTQEVSIRALAERVRALSGSSSPIKLVPYDEAYESGFEDMPRRLPDLRKIAAMIGYQPQYSMDDILAQVIEYFRSQ